MIGYSFQVGCVEGLGAEWDAAERHWIGRGNGAPGIGYGVGDRQDAHACIAGRFAVSI